MYTYTFSYKTVRTPYASRFELVLLLATRLITDTALYNKTLPMVPRRSCVCVSTIRRRKVKLITNKTTTSWKPKFWNRSKTNDYLFIYLHDNSISKPDLWIIVKKKQKSRVMSRLLSIIDLTVKIIIKLYFYTVHDIINTCRR